MANFDIAFKLVLQHEGGLTDDPVDPGGITKFGITLPDLPKGSTADDIRNLTIIRAEEIYKAKYWNPLRCDEILSQPIADIFFDIGVAKGLTGTTTQMRIALGLHLPPVSWGHLDDATLKAINAHSDTAPLQVAFDFLAACDDSRIQRVKDNGVLLKFLPGWLRRDRHNLAHVFGLKMVW